MTHKELKERLHYDPLTGIFTWIKANKQFLGKKAGYLNQEYIKIKLNKGYLAHRLAWLYVYGEFPTDCIDHINGIKTDNRISNLRDVSNQTNMKNQKRRNTNKSGITGVFWHKTNKMWTSTISVNYKQIHLGSFSTKEDAISARKTAEIKYKYHQNHGR